MKTLLPKLISVLFVFLISFDAIATTRYVDLNSPSPTPPFTNWLTAAVNIQDAIDAAGAGDLVLVTNGIYASGGRVVYGSMTNRVVVNKALTIQSVNGPDATFIRGNSPANGIAVRCVYLTNNATLIGFTLTNGFTRGDGEISLEQAGGGVWAEGTNALVSNCVFVGNWADYYGGGAYGCTLTNCQLSDNAAKDGGGAANSILIHCVIHDNQSGFGGGGGGGVFSSSLEDCVITNNYGGARGGGAWYSTLVRCLLKGNGASTGGGGASDCDLRQCTISGNGSSEAAGGVIGSILNECLIEGNTGYGGAGAVGSTLNNCILTGNIAYRDGAGAEYCTLNNCTLVNNSCTADDGYAGGASSSELNNCIVISNSAATDPNYSDCAVNYSCTSPLPTNGVANISSSPGFVDFAGGNLRLLSNSLCINAGNNSYITNSGDFDGNPRIAGATVDIGAHEFQSPTSLLSYAWAQQNGFPIDGSADFTDVDGDGANNWQEWRADTNPTNAISVLRMISAKKVSGGSQVVWQSVTTRSYWLERATNLNAAPLFQTVATNIVGDADTRTFTDLTATNDGANYFYRVGVQ